MATYLSDRQIPLIFCGDPPAEGRILTMENYIKWYEIYAVGPGGAVEKVDPDVFERCQSHAWQKPATADMIDDVYFLGQALHSWSDHIPYPPILYRIAAELGAEWDENSVDMIVGRYKREICGELP